MSDATPEHNGDQELEREETDGGDPLWIHSADGTSIMMIAEVRAESADGGSDEGQVVQIKKEAPDDNEKIVDEEGDFEINFDVIKEAPDDNEDCGRGGRLRDRL